MDSCVGGGNIGNFILKKKKNVRRGRDTRGGSGPIKANPIRNDA